MEKKVGYSSWPLALLADKRKERDWLSGLQSGDSLPSHPIQSHRLRFLGSSVKTEGCRYW